MVFIRPVTASAPVWNGWLNWIQGAHFRPEDIAYLRGQVNGQGQRVFDDDFLRWLEAECDFSQITLRAIPEGRVVHPGVPLTAVQGPLAMAQLLEDGPAQPHQLPDSDRYQGRPHLREWARAPVTGIRAAPRA